MESHETPSLAALPNEVLFHVLIPLSTCDLVQLASLCHRFHDLVVRIVAVRLRRAASLDPHFLLLEAYHPVQRATEPPYPCSYLGTDGLDDGTYHDEPIDNLRPGQRFRELAAMYSRFRPHRRQIEKKNPLRHPAGDVPGSRTFRSSNTNPNDAAAQSSASPSGTPALSEINPTQLAQAAEPITQPVYEPVIQRADLEAGVRFTQLCADTTVIIAGPRVSLFSGHQQVEKGVIRVFRDWLAEQASLGAAKLLESEGNGEIDDAGENPAELPMEPSNNGNGKGQRSCRPCTDVRTDRGVLWVGHRQSVGIRFNVRQPTWRPQYNPISVRADEELPVSYEIEYEELLVRTVDLLLASEKVVAKQQSSTGKAIVIGAWAA